MHALQKLPCRSHILVTPYFSHVSKSVRHTIETANESYRKKMNISVRETKN